MTDLADWDLRTIGQPGEHLKEIDICMMAELAPYRVGPLRIQRIPGYRCGQ